MGNAPTCSQQACSPCTHGGPPPGSLAEYEPQSKADSLRECLDVEPHGGLSPAARAPAVVEAIAGVLRAPAPSGGEGGYFQTRGVSSPLHSRSREDENYFLRELAELQRLPGGAEGLRPPHTFRSGAVYHGQWRGAARHGIGRQTWEDGAEFCGMWADNKAQGSGRFAHADGDVYLGQWALNCAQGLGTCYQAKDTTTYCGEWLSDLQHGVGVEQWQGGAKFCGQFVRGRKEGYGVYEWPDGSSYSGGWQDNAIDGSGRYTTRDGRSFQGQWQRAAIHGCGQYSWSDGRRYRGQYEGDQKHGFGSFVWKDERRFQGFWRAGVQHGAGMTYRPDGSVLKQGQWSDGRPPEAPTAPEAQVSS